MTTNKLSLFFIGLFFSMALFAQNEEVAIGQWRSYLPYTKGAFVTQSNSTVYYAADFSLLAIDKGENSVERLTKVNGLNDVEIELLKYNPFGEELILVYQNGNIDIVYPDEIVNIPFLKQASIIGDRGVYDIHFVSATRALLATGFGILEINPQTAKVVADIRTSIKVNSITSLDDNFYAATDEGIYQAKNDPSINLLDFTNNWQLLGSAEGLSDDYSSSAIIALEDRLVFAIDDSLVFYQNGVSEKFYSSNGFGIQFLSADGAHLIAGIDCNSGCVSDKVVFLEKDGTLLREVGQSCSSGALQYAIEDEQGRIWMADKSAQFRVFQDINSRCDSTIYEGPASGQLWDLEVKGDELWIATGGFDETKSYLFRRDGILRLQSDGFWTQYNRTSRPEFRGEDGIIGGGDDVLDLIKIKAHPTTETVFLGSYIEGLLEFDLQSNTMELFNENNSAIGEPNGDPNRSRIGGIAIDQNENVWITNFLADEPLVVFEKDGSSRNFSTSRCGNFTELLDIVVDGANNKWMIVENTGGGLIVFNEGDLNDPNDDVCRPITTTNSNLPSNEVLSIEVDLDGDVWVGTTNGVVIFQCGSQALDAEVCPGFLQIVNVGGDNENLLKGESVQAIAVDGANRKWFGTLNGVFLQSPSGDELLASFTETNSPLFDNNIVDIAIRQETGEVFIGTARGLQSIRTDAASGFAVNTANINVFPNPVRPEYDGPIAVNGLARDADIKITDISGKLVYETTALGGQAIWDGRDYNGRKAASGVYLVFSTSTRNFDNPDAAVAKILIVR